MKRRTTIMALLSGIVTVSSFAQSLSFSGNSLKVLEETPEKSTGLEKIYVLYSTQGVSVSYTSPSGNRISWMKYGNLGGGHAEDVASTQTGNTSTLSSLEGDKGYIITDGDRQYCFWITDYQAHRLRLQSASVSGESECGVSIIDVTGSGEPIRYFTINGMQKTLNQDITVEYTTQEWNDNDNDNNFNETSVSKSFECLQNQYRLTPPNYCTTTFVVKGDKFLKAWNWLESVETPSVRPMSVAARTFAFQSRDDNGCDVSTSTTVSNQIGS